MKFNRSYTRDLQWWCFAWLTRCFVNSGCCVVVLW